MTAQSLPKIEVYRIYHRNEFRLGLFFDINQNLIAVCKQLGLKFSNTHKCWHNADTNENLKTILVGFKGKAMVDYRAINQKLKPNELSLFKKEYIKANQFSQQRIKSPSELSNQKKANTLEDIVPMAYKEKLKVRRYSESTYKTYVSLFNRFVHYYTRKFDKPLSEANGEEIKEYVLKLIQKFNISQSTQNQVINAIKFYYEQVLNQKRETYWIERPRREQKLPQILSEEEVIRLIISGGNFKHQCIIAMIYSAGLRRSELINLKIKDLNFDRKQVFIRGAKGKKDRVSLLSDRLANGLIKYLNEYKPKVYLFENESDNPLSGSTIGSIVKNACKRANMKHITPHILRHSFATHLMDKGTDTRIIQELLGHQSLETTAIYTHVSTKSIQSIKSPLDGIFGSMEQNKTMIDKTKDG